MVCVCTGMRNLFLSVCAASALWILCLPAWGQTTESPLEQLRNLYASAQYEACLEACVGAIGSGFSHPEAWRFRADCLQKLDRNEEAIEAYRKAISLDEKQSDYHTNLGSALLTEERFDEAMKHLDKAVNYDKQNARAYYYRGNAHYFLFELGKAMRDYNAALELDTAYKEALYMRAATRAERQDINGALKDYAQTLELDDKLDVARINMAALLMTDGYTTAANSLLEAVNLKPGEPGYDTWLFNKAEMAYLNGETEKACDLYKRSSDLGDAEALNIYETYCVKKQPRKDQPVMKTSKIVL